MNNVKKNLIFFICFLLLGVSCLIYGTLGQSLTEYNSSLLHGLSLGFGLTGLLGSLICLKFMKDPKKCAEIEICKNEERTVFIREKTNSMVYSIFIYIESITLVICGLLGYRSVSLAISFLVIGKLVFWFIFGTYYGKKY